MRLLVVRNDKLGDFMLAWPVFALLKQQWPEATVCALVPEYTLAMAELCPWIDEVVIDQRLDSKLVDVITLRKQFRRGRFDAMLTLFSSGRVALAGCLAGIPYRLAPATKMAQLCYNHRQTQRRSRSEKPEYAYNLDLAYQLLYELRKHARHGTASTADDDYLPPEIPRPLLQFDSGETAQLRELFCTQHNISTGSRLIFIHPGSGGSANTLKPDQYAQLARSLNSTVALSFVISAGPGEEEAANALRDMLTPLLAIVLRPQNGLTELSRHLQFADLFISGSTGPLHIAGALNCPTAAFYPRHRSGSPLRWQTLNSPGKRLAFTPPDDADEKDVSSIDVIAAARAISDHFLS
jgi:ADP-heptose:LPS heptosyltransferase